MKSFLKSGERTFYLSKPHIAIIFLKAIYVIKVSLVVFFLLGLIVNTEPGEIDKIFIFFILAAIYTFFEFLLYLMNRNKSGYSLFKYFITSYAITNNRVLVSYGLSDVGGRSIQRSDIASVLIEQNTLYQKILGYGDVLMLDSRNVVLMNMPYVKRPKTFKKLLNK